MEAKLLEDPRPQVDLRLQVVKPLMERNKKNQKDQKLLVDLRPQAVPRLLVVKPQRNQRNLKDQKLLVDLRLQVDLAVIAVAGALLLHESGQIAAVSRTSIL